MILQQTPGETMTMTAQYPMAAKSISTRCADLSRGLGQRLKGPGGLYNLGNAIGFTGGLVAALIAVPANEFSFSSALAAASCPRVAADSRGL